MEFISTCFLNTSLFFCFMTKLDTKVLAAKSNTTKLKVNSDSDKASVKELNADISSKKPSLSNLKLIGTSHIAKQSVNQVEDFLDTYDVDYVCIELDRQRLYALQNNVESKISIKNIGMAKQIGLTGFIFALIASAVQKSLGKKVKTKPGSDMLAAVKSAAKRKIPIALIDQNVNITLQKLSKYLTFKEKFRIVSDLIKGLLGFKSELTGISSSDLDLSKVPSDRLIEVVLEKTKDRYPNFYRALVSERNEFMSDRIFGLMNAKPDSKVLVIIGAGHKEGMVKYLENKFKDTYSDSWKNESVKSSDDNYSFSFGHEE